MIGKRLAVMILVASIFAIPSITWAQGTSVTGNVTYLQRVALPTNAIITIQLADVSQAGVPAPVIAQQVIPTNGAQVPVPFTLTYNPARINPNGRYTIQGNIRVDGQTRFQTTREYLVITGGRAASNIQVIMDQVGTGNLPTTSGSGETSLVNSATLLYVSLLLVLGLLGVRLTRLWLDRRVGRAT